jgi:glucokinase
MAQLLFDIGGTKMRFAISSDGKTLGATEIVPTPASFAEALATIKKVASNLSGGQKFEAIAGGVAGTFNKEKTVLSSAPHLKEWIGQPLVELLQQEFACSVYLENDTAMVGLGEASLIEEVGEKIVAYITVSTGVGGVRIVDGKIDRHTNSFEPGHQIINLDTSSPSDHDQKLRDLESYVSGSAVRLATQKEPQDINDEVFWNDLAKILAVGLHNTILHWTPEVVVLGGSMFKIHGIPFEVIKNQLAQSLSFLPFQPQLKLAQLGDLGGLHGALAFLNQQSVL